MSTDRFELTVPRPTGSLEPSGRRWWSVITVALVAAIFAQAVFAGAMLSGVEWARAAHAANALAVVVATFAATVVSIVTLRRFPDGLKFSLTLLALAVTVFVQFGLGRMTVKGANLMWVHVPLGVALVGFAMRAVTVARRLGRP